MAAKPSLLITDLDDIEIDGLTRRIQNLLDEVRNGARVFNPPRPEIHIQISAATVVKITMATTEGQPVAVLNRPDDGRMQGFSVMEPQKDLPSDTPRFIEDWLDLLSLPRIATSAPRLEGRSSPTEAIAIQAATIIAETRTDLQHERMRMSVCPPSLYRGDRGWISLENLHQAFEIVEGLYDLLLADFPPSVSLHRSGNRYEFLDAAPTIHTVSPYSDPMQRMRLIKLSSQFPEPVHPFRD